MIVNWQCASHSRDALLIDLFELDDGHNCEPCFTQVISKNGDTETNRSLYSKEDCNSQQNSSFSFSYVKLKQLQRAGREQSSC